MEEYKLNEGNGPNIKTTEESKMKIKMDFIGGIYKNEGDEKNAKSESTGTK